MCIPLSKEGVYQMGAIWVCSKNTGIQNHWLFLLIIEPRSGCIPILVFAAVFPLRGQAGENPEEADVISTTQPHPIH
jgi:hypothetical protein